MLLLLMLGAFAARAQTLDLEQAIEMALNADPRISEKEHLARAAQTLVDEAEGADGLIFDVNTFIGLAPEQTGGFFTNGTNTCTALPCSVRDDGTDFDEVSLWANLRFAIIKPLYTFGKIEHYSEAARGNLQLKREEIRIQRVTTRMQVTKAYYGYLAARDTRRLLENERERAAKALTLVETWLAEGRAGAKQSETYALRTGIAVLNTFLAKAAAVEKIALDGLKVLTGIGLGGELRVADNALRPVEAPRESLEDLQAQALAERPEIAQLEAGLEARRSLVAARKADQKPNLYAGVIGSVAAAPDRTRLDHPFISDPFNHAGATPVIGLQWSWDSGRQPAQAARAQAELDALIELSSFARLGIPFEVAEKVHQLGALQTAVRELEQGSRNGRRWMIASYADFEAGVEESSRVIEAFRTYVLTHSEYLQAVNDYNMKVSELRQVTGAFR